MQRLVSYTAYVLDKVWQGSVTCSGTQDRTIFFQGWHCVEFATTTLMAPSCTLGKLTGLARPAHASLLYLTKYIETLKFPLERTYTICCWLHTPQRMHLLFHCLTSVIQHRNSPPEHESAGHGKREQLGATMKP